AVKGVDDEVFRKLHASPRGATQEEMSREIDTPDIQIRAACDFHIQKSERNRNTGSPIEDFVQEAVARILVLQVVPDEMQLAEQVLVEGFHSRVAHRVDARWRVAGFHGRRGDADLRLVAEGI